MQYNAPNWVNNGSPAINAANLQAISDTLEQDGQEIQALFYAVGGPNVASTISAMTNKQKVYVYTGSEAGYTAGNWYFWNGSEWVSGGVYNSTALETDTTLSISGAAADAKVTGYEITEAKLRLKATEDAANQVLFANEIFCYTTTEGYELVLTGNKRSRMNENAKVCYYGVKPGDVVYINCLLETEGCWCFSDRNNLGGLTGNVSNENDCYVTIPDNVNYICVSSLLTNTTNKLYTMKNARGAKLVYSQDLISHDCLSWCDNVFLTRTNETPENKLYLGHGDGSHSFFFHCTPNSQYIIFKPRGLRFIVGYTSSDR